MSKISQSKITRVKSCAARYFCVRRELVTDEDLKAFYKLGWHKIKFIRYLGWETYRTLAAYLGMPDPGENVGKADFESWYECEGKFLKHKEAAFAAYLKGTGKTT